MSLKNVEMQIAIPKTVDAGKIQHDQNNRALIMNAQTHISVEKNEERKRKTVSKNHETNNLKLKKDGRGNNQSSFSEREIEQQQNAKEEEMHPFKGKFIDYKG
ncbi:hypothetical protein [Fervidibacillus halotolerans]|uniref:RNA polymerase subunit sigma n=1 Tax=Fervidibacillus halotolerans TaxID=2980027 RepID=A0A9E8M268_9BACI|nr:hypothetical protein [Fervidibacillus halotolerans]WAA13580.1 hypothetical protein OE105_05605 [Fervidibacillus halotolerans]